MQSWAYNTYSSLHRSRLRKYYLPYLVIGQNRIFSVQIGQGLLIASKRFSGFIVIALFLVRTVESENFPCTYNLGEFDD